jgi:hypothetical protein
MARGEGLLLQTFARAGKQLLRLTSEAAEYASASNDRFSQGSSPNTVSE